MKNQQPRARCLNCGGNIPNVWGVFCHGRGCERLYVRKQLRRGNKGVRDEISRLRAGKARAELSKVLSPPKRRRIDRNLR